MKVEIWSDVVCPWCYVGKRRLEAALARFPHRAQVEVVWRSFELDPTGATGARDQPYVDRLAAKYGTGRQRAQEMLDAMTAAAAAEGLEYHFELARPASSFDAHQLIHLAAGHGRQDAMKERLLRAYFTEGRDIGDRAVLAQLAVQVGLEAAEVTAALADQRHAGAVRQDESEATALGISGVPFFVVDRRYGVSGAQPVEGMLEALSTAWAQQHPLTVVSTAGGAEPACGPDGCVG